MIVVFDTNVFIAALVTEGLCSRLLRRARMNSFSLVCSPFINEEVRGTLSKKLHLSSEDTSEAMEVIGEAISSFVVPDVTVSGVCHDSSDDNILACALMAKADYLVTGDADLLEIKDFKGTRIVTPRDFEALFV